MDDKFKKSLLIVCKLFQKHHVQFLVIGGTAVALYGYFRFSMNISGEFSVKPDIDIWYNPSYENYFRVLKVIEDLGQDISSFMSEQSPNPQKSFFKLDFEDYTLDILPTIKAPIKFFDAVKNKEAFELEEIEIPLLSYFDLFEDKKATARKKDIEDMNQLSKLRKKN